MKKWTESFKNFAKNKLYVLVLALTAAGSYGFMITHHTVGIDDTPYAYYFEEGLAAIVGRWVCFLLNKVVSIGDFAPFLTDFAGVLILMAAVTVWCVLFHSVLEERVPWYGYLFFACIFISCPLISEVYVYYLHNGIAIGYLCSGISLCLLQEGLSGQDKAGTVAQKLGRKALTFAGSAICLWIALGCYESFMMVWLTGVCLLLAAQRMCGEKKNVFAVVGIAGIIALCAMILRSLMISGVTAAFGLEYLRDEAVQRSVTELIGWILEQDAFAEFAMILKRTYVMYGVFALAYYPIKVFILATIVIVLAGIVMSIRKRDAWIFLLIIMAYIAAFSLVVIEGKATYYRSAQFLPLICGFGALLLVWGSHAFANKRKGWLAACSKGLACTLLTVILWNQCADMNNWFYIDWQKYEAAKETMSNVAYELEKGFDISKPVIFTGIYEIPSEIIKDAYVSYSSSEYAAMVNLTSWLDPRLLDKFYRQQGVWVAQQPTLSVIEWGRTAFDSNQELVTFLKMHGHSVNGITDKAVFASILTEAEGYSATLPEFPKEGSIVDMGEYIIVHF